MIETGTPFLAGSGTVSLFASNFGVPDFPLDKHRALGGKREDGSVALHVSIKFSRFLPMVENRFAEQRRRVVHPGCLVWFFV